MLQFILEFPATVFGNEPLGIVGQAACLLPRAALRLLQDLAHGSV